MRSVARNGDREWAGGLLLVFVALLAWAASTPGGLERSSLLALVVGDSMLVAEVVTVMVMEFVGGRSLRMPG